MKKPPKVTPNAALATLYGCYRRHGHEGFVISRGPDRAFLLYCLDAGWLYGWNDHVRITPAGVTALQPYLEEVSA